jgi:integrase
MAGLGVPPRVAMELLGHSQIGVTMNVYSHIASEYQRAAVDLVGDALWGETTNMK